MQLTIFDIETPATALICEKPTKKYPGGRTGTIAGYIAHKEAKETPCDACREGRRNYRRKYREDNLQLVTSQERAGYMKRRDAELKKKHDYYVANREEMLERERMRRNNNREKLQEYQRQWYAKNREKVTSQKRESKKKWYDANPEKAQARRKEYREKNLDKVRQWENENTHRRRALKRSLPSDGYTFDDITRTHGTVCYLCGTEVNINAPAKRPESPEIDHVHPLSRPGCPGDVLSNVRWTHKACNSSKLSKLVSELSLPLPAPDLI